MLKPTTNSAAEDYDVLSADVQQKAFRNLVSPLKIEPGFKCLDIGCGTGANMAWLAEKVGNDGHVLGIDPDEKRIKVASEKYKDYRNLDFIIGKSVDIPPCNGGYDFIVSNYVMHWVNHDDTVETYRRALNALKPGGLIVILENSALDKCQKALHPNCSDEMREKLLSAFHFSSSEENRKILTEIGFQIIEIEEFVIKYDFESLDKCFKWYDATLHGAVNTREIYERNKSPIDVMMNDNGSITDEYYNIRTVATKNS